MREQRSGTAEIRTSQVASIIVLNPKLYLDWRTQNLLGRLGLD